MQGSGETIPQPRKRRMAPQAPGPVRGPANIRKDSRVEPMHPDGSGAGDGGLNGATSAAAENGIIAASVRAAYAVVDRNLQEGRNAAERLRAAGVSQADPPNARDLANRMLHLSRDLGAAWIDLVGTLLREPDVRSMIDRLSTGDRAQPAHPAAAPTTVTQRISSRRPIETTLSPLHLADATRPPGIAGLHSVAAGTPPIGSVHFAARPGGLELCLAIADDQPAGAYAGTIVDADSQAPIGTLAVRILE